VIIELLSLGVTAEALQAKIQGGQRNGTVVWYALTSSNINRFSKLFYCQNQEKMYNNNITKDSTTPHHTTPHHTSHYLVNYQVFSKQQLKTKRL